MLLFRLLVIGALVALPLAGTAAAQSARTTYERALARDKALRSGERRTPPPLSQLRAVVAAYDRVVRRYPRSGYADNALWNAADVCIEAFERYGSSSDRDRAVKLLRHLTSQYPSSSLVKQARARVRELERSSRTLSARGSTSKPAARETPTPVEVVAIDDAPAAPAPAATVPDPPSSGPVRIRDIRRTVLPEVLRVTIELDREVEYRQDRLANPSRVYFDLKNAIAPEHLQDGELTYADDVVRQIRLGRHPGNTTRIVFGCEESPRYSVFVLYNPFRLVIDFDRPEPLRAEARPVTTPVRTSGTTTGVVQRDEPIQVRKKAQLAGAMPSAAAIDSRAVSRQVAPEARPVALPLTLPPSPQPAAGVIAEARKGRTPAAAKPARSTPPGATARSNRREPTPESGGQKEPALPRESVAPPVLPPPVAPRANAGGTFSLARQLGLGVSRIVIDPGHGGHDPGALGRNITEASLVLDIALRLEKLLLKQRGIDVVLTRRTDVFVPLEERTAIANREQADLFLSIHANASRNKAARGIETYFLNFATNADAEAVAARENSASARAMHQLPDIVKAIALNNKLDESRDFATTVQSSLVKRLKTHNAEVRDLGVKQAPFVVLIGAGMPSILAEISFVTNAREAQLLRTPAYRQRIAEALFDGVVRYQRALKGTLPAVAQETRRQEEEEEE